MCLPRLPEDLMADEGLKQVVVADLVKHKRWNPQTKKLVLHVRDFYFGQLGTEKISVFRKTPYIGTSPVEGTHKELNEDVQVKHPHYNSFCSE